MQPDRQIKFNVFGVGYPQVNLGWIPFNNEGPVDVPDHWVVNDPTGWSTTWHELGHSMFQSGDVHRQYMGETEAINNFLLP